MIKAASVQFNHRPNDKAYNLQQIDHFCKKATSEGVDIIAFPEMCITGYWHVRNLSRDEIDALSEDIESGPSVERIKRLAKEHNLLIGAGLIEKAPSGELYNTYVAALPDGSVQRHRKIHCFISEHMSSGSEYTVFDTHLGVRVGILICYDNNLVENARITALEGADILLAPHQTGGCGSRSPHGMTTIDPYLWENRDADPQSIEEAIKGPNGREWLLRWLPSRAHDNGMFILFSNGVGIDDDEVRTGNAMIIDCYGRIVSETWKADDDMVVANLDLDLLDRCTGRRWLRARRPDLYSRLTEATGKEFSPREARFSRESTE